MPLLSAESVILEYLTSMIFQDSEIRPTVVFMLSTSHAGSTWLNLVLGSHSWAQNLGEYHRPFIMPGHVACRLCEANGLSECTMLHGIEQIDSDQAFHFAAERSGKSILIDASKSIEWCRRFVARTDMDVKIIHLFRHPCGFVESFVRRHAEFNYETALARWEEWNCKISAFLATVPVPTIDVCYEELADRPEQFFPALCDFLGQRWESGALEYWKTEHHGLGGNGSASVYLRDRVAINYRTGDDQFYDGVKERPLKADRRWMERLPGDFMRKVMLDPYVEEIRSRFTPGIWLDAVADATPLTRMLPDIYANDLSPGAGHYRAYVGPPGEYDTMGAMQFRLLTTLGLREFHKVLDFGCGSLRLGRLLIPYLQNSKYFGLDPNRWLIDDAIERQLGQNILEIKRPVFSYSDAFAADMCGTDFDFIVAQSVFSHTGRDLFRRGLQGFKKALAPGGLALITVLHPDQADGAEFERDGWVYPQCVGYAPETLQTMFREADLAGREIPFHHPRQHWYLLARSQDRLPAESFDVHLGGHTVDTVRSDDSAISAAAPYILGSSVELKDPSSDIYLKSGFSYAEEWGRWTDGVEAHIVLDVHAPQPVMRLELWIASATVGTGEHFEFTLTVDNGLAKPCRVGPQGGLVWVDFMRLAGRPIATIRVRIEMPCPRKPDFSPGGDKRSLGIAVSAFRISAVPLAIPDAMHIRSYDPNAVLVSLHLAKTAGTSFKEVLHAWFGSGLIPHYRPDIPAEPITGAGICVHGHFEPGNGTGFQLRYPGAQTITVLRDPFDKLISYWVYANESLKPHGMAAADLKDNPSFEQWFERWINPPPGKVRASFLRQFPVPVLTEIDQETAEAILRRDFLAVGLTERMADTVRLFADVLGKPAIDIPHVNRSSRRDGAYEHYRAAYKESRPTEYIIYEAAKKIFEEKMGPAI